MSKNIPDRINNDEEYHAVLKRLVRGAQMIEDPLTTNEERERYNKGYDQLCALIDDYKEKEREEFERRLKGSQMPVSQM